MDSTDDLAVIDGGVNGWGIASGMSSAATQLVRRGLRYLEHRGLRLVREASMDREVPWGIAPHIIRSLRSALPRRRGLRPAWLLRPRLLVYGHLGGRKRLPATRTLDLRTDPAGGPPKPGRFRRGFEHSDCWVEDSRLAALNARAAVDAAGPWVGQVLNDTLGRNGAAEVRLVQGSPVVVPRMYDHDRCCFRNPDGRIPSIPHETDIMPIGTTDRDHEGDPGDMRATPDEVSYVCASASAHLAHAGTPADAVWGRTRLGLRLSAAEVEALDRAVAAKARPAPAPARAA